MTIQNTARLRNAGVMFDAEQIKTKKPIAEVIGARIQLKANGRELEGLCCFHNEKTASFTVVPAKGFAHCFGCGWHGDQIAFVQEFHGVDFKGACEILGGERPAPAYKVPRLQIENDRDYFADLKPAPLVDVPPVVVGKPVRYWNPKRSKWQSLTPELVHPYRSPDGALLGYVLRAPMDDKKWTPCIRYAVVPDGSKGWALWPFNRPRPLYGLDRLSKRPGVPVLVVEGEKCSDAAARVLPEYVTVTWCGGGKSVQHTDWSPLAGRDVMIWPDADLEGERTAALLLPLAQAIAAKSISLLQWDRTKGKGWDVADAEQDGWSHDQLLEWISANRLVKPLSADDLNEGPMPLRRPLPPPMEFPMPALGQHLRPAAEAIHALTQAPAAICAQSVLAVGALTVQAFVDVMPPYGINPRPSSLFFCSVAETGDRKTNCDAYALAPVNQYQRELSEASAVLRQEYENKIESWEHAREAAKKGKAGKVAMVDMEQSLRSLGAKPVEPPHSHIICTEPTGEGLQKMMRLGQGYCGLFSDEGGSFIGGHAMNSDNKTKTAAQMSQSWDGSPISRVRQGDESGTWYGRRCSVHLMVQPDIAAQLLSDELLKGQGLLSRFLVSYPPSTAGTREFREARPEHLDAIAKYTDHMLTLLRRPRVYAERDQSELLPRVLSLCPAAKELWASYYNANERGLAPDGPLASIKGLASKMPEHALRMACVLSEVNHPGCTAIDAESMAGAIVLAGYYTSEALRLFDAGVSDPNLVLAEKALEFIRSRGGEIHLAELYQEGPRAIRSADKARQILKVLAEHSYVERLEQGKVIDGTLRRDVWRARS